MTALLEGLNPDYKLLAPEVEVIAKAIGGDKGKIDAVAASAGEWIKKDLSGANMSFLRNNSGLVGEIQGKITGVVGTELSTSLASAKYDWQKSYMVVQAGLKALGYKGRGGAELRLNGIFSEDMFIALLTYQLSSENYKKKDYGTVDKGDANGLINGRALNAMLEDLKAGVSASVVTPAPVEVAKPAAVPVKEAPPVADDRQQSPETVSNQLKIVVEGDGSYLVDESSDFISETYDKIERMPDGNFKCELDGKQGLLSSDSGEIIMPVQYDNLLFLGKGKYKVRLATQWQVIELTNSYEEVEEHGAITFFQQNGKWGIMSKDGSVIVQAQHEELKWDRFGVIHFQQNGKWGLLSMDAKTILLEAIYDDIVFYSSDEIRVQQDGKRGLLARDYKTMIIDMKFENISIGRYYMVQLNGKWGFWSKNHKTVVGEIKYDSVVSGTYENAIFGERAIVKQGDKYGLVSLSTGKEIIPVKYSEYSRIDTTDLVIFIIDGKKGVVDVSTGDFIVPAEYDSLSYSSQGIILGKGGKFGLYVKNKMLLPAEFDEIVESSNGYRIRKDGKWGLVVGDTVVLKPEYDDIQTFGDGFRVQKGGKFGLMVNGKRALPVEYDKIDGRNIQKGGKVGLLSADFSSLLLEAQYDAIEIKDSGNVVVKLDGKLGLTYPNSGKLLLPVEYDKIDQRWIQKDGKWGLLGKSLDRIQLEATYDAATITDDGRVLVRLDGQRGLTYADSGQLMVPIKYDWLHVWKDGRVAFYDGSIFPGVTGDRGLLTPDGKNIAVEARYEGINVWKDGRISFKKDGSWGLLSKDGKTVVVEAKYEDINVENDGKILIKLNGKWGLLSADGKTVIVEAKYSTLQSIGYYGVYFQIGTGKWGLFSQDGKRVLIEPEYDNIEIASSGQVKLTKGDKKIEKQIQF